MHVRRHRGTRLGALPVLHRQQPVILSFNPRATEQPVDVFFVGSGEDLHMVRLVLGTDAPGTKSLSRRGMI